MLEQVVITKDLIGDEPLHFIYLADFDVYLYYCKYFMFWEDYCVIEKGVAVEEDGPMYLEDLPVIDKDFWIYKYDKVLSEPYFKISKGQKYAMLSYSEVTYKIPFKFYKNLIKNLGCFVFVCADNDYISTYKKPLVLVDDNNAVIGIIESDAFEIEFSSQKENIKYIFDGVEI